MEDGDIFDEILLSDTLSETFLQVVELQILRTVLQHPLRYVTTLIQLGYEPLPPTLEDWYFIGEPTMVLPNKFVYLKHIYDIDGFGGCFRGLGSTVTSSCFSVFGYYIIIAANIQRVFEAANENDFFSLMKWDCITTLVANILNHPFYVLANRQMAQFIGKEVQYNKGIIIGLFEIARNEGITGLFSGLFPKMIAEISALLIFYNIMFIVYRHRVRINEYPSLLYVGISYVIFSFTYPLRTVSVCMSVNGSGLQAGSPPFMPDYKHDWLRCYDHLSFNNQFYRGGSCFWRPYITSQ